MKIMGNLLKSFHKGEAIQIIDEQSKLLIEIKALREEMAAIKRSEARIVELFKRWDCDGLPAIRHKR